MSPKVISHLALFIVALLYGGNYIIARDVMHKELLQPLGFVLLRDVAACVLFWLFHTLFIRERILKKHIPRLALCGLLGVAVNQSFFFSGLKLTTPIHASLMMTSTPILVLIASQILLKERITPRKLTGILIACTGAIVLITRRDSVLIASNTALGDAMILLNATSYALYLVTVKPLLKNYRPVTVITWIFTFGTLYMIPVGFHQLASAPWGSFESLDWVFIGYVLLGVTFLAYLLNVLALKHVSPNVVSIYIYLQPVFAAILSMMILDETMGVLKWIAAIAIFSGVYLVSFSNNRQTI